MVVKVDSQFFWLRCSWVFPLPAWQRAIASKRHAPELRI